MKHIKGLVTWLTRASAPLQPHPPSLLLIPEMDSGQNPIYHLTSISSHFGEHSGNLGFQRLVSAQRQCLVIPEATHICLPPAQLPSLWLPGPLGEIYCLYLWPSCRVLSHQHNVASLSIKRVWVWEVGEREVWCSIAGIADFCSPVRFCISSSALVSRPSALFLGVNTFLWSLRLCYSLQCLHPPYSHWDQASHQHRPAENTQRILFFKDVSLTNASQASVKGVCFGTSWGHWSGGECVSHLPQIRSNIPS